MKYSTSLLAIVGLAAASPVDMGPYKPDSDVDAAFSSFVKEYGFSDPYEADVHQRLISSNRYYRVSEDEAATTSFTDFWPADGSLVAAGNTFKGSASILTVKQKLLPPEGNKAWWHPILGANVVSEDSKTKTINAKIIIQTTYTPGNCSQAHGNAAFTVAKDADGVPNWTAHTGCLLVYNLTVNTIQTPTDEACTAT
ncbi:hypothetical protein PG991_005406 [Apiospora marii]|uniref:Uncharacterized protein n=1 Tax=Apiospora marii TaxID=335849 RepID=A0ABR1SAC4_9PEZI